MMSRRNAALESMKRKEKQNKETTWSRGISACCGMERFRVS